jgi:uncharacterized membrane protein SirB2
VNPPHFDNEYSPSVLPRIASLLTGGAYLAYLSGVACVTTGTPFWLTTVLVLAGAVAIMAVMVACGVKLERQQGPIRRFGLSTVFLITIPLSIYLAAIRWMLQAATPQSLTLAQWMMVGLIGITFLLVTNILLLHLAEALMWIAVAVQRWLRRRGRKHDATP